jgi:tetrahydromethanopterin S-methyltransferase subunit G
MCSEYAILAARIAQKIGEPIHLVIGAVVGNDEQKWRDAHAFVWVEGVNAVFDSVQAQSDNEYPALMIPTSPATLKTLEDGFDVEAKRIGRDFTAHYGLEAGGFGITLAHEHLGQANE